MAKKIRSGGRPSRYREEYAKQAHKLCLLGAIDKELADFFGVTEQTVNNWKRSHKEFFESLKKGKLLADAEVAGKLFSRATGYSHDAVKIVADAKTGAEHIVPFTEHYPPDTTACIFWLKNRQRDKWRDRVDSVVTGPNDGPIEAKVTHRMPGLAEAIVRAQSKATEVAKQTAANAGNNDSN